METTFSENEFQPRLVEVRWVVVLLRIVGVHPFSKWENVFSHAFPIFVNFILCKKSFVGNNLIVSR